MRTSRYLNLIKNSSEEDLKLYIYIIESELGYKKGEVIDLSNTNKSNLQLKLKELIREKLDIEWQYLEENDLTKDECEDLDDFISSLFSRSLKVRGDIRTKLEWLSEPRAQYFFSVLIRAAINNDIIDLPYPVTSIDFKTPKPIGSNRNKHVQTFIDSIKTTHFLTSLKSICPNKTSSAHEAITRTLEYIVASCELSEQRVLFQLISNIETLYQISFRDVNAKLNVFTSDDEILISEYCHYLVNKYPQTGLFAANDTIKQKHTIMCIFDVLCVTTPDRTPHQGSNQDVFKKVVKKLTDEFSRRVNRKSSGTNTSKTKEEKTLTFSETDWEKLAVISGGHSKNQIKAKLKELIDVQLEKVKDETATNSVNTDEDNIKNVTNDSSEKHESTNRVVEMLSSVPSSMGRRIPKRN
ncbi:hypothetical protein [Vibrio cyclitrophicus]|uniref:hypothetical protein n=1 Tax=Vibrio cyclitrophicus TaxID=47951 RepID=UPI000C83B5AD|nr:hypothetical protein [Vibrio cyclitrophicus]PMH77103.1 hypothetical protein BCU59_10155 [Vibrio cyclitrophicus]